MPGVFLFDHASQLTLENSLFFFSSIRLEPVWCSSMRTQEKQFNLFSPTTGNQRRSGPFWRARHSGTFGMTIIVCVTYSVGYSDSSDRFEWLPSFWVNGRLCSYF